MRDDSGIGVGGIALWRGGAGGDPLGEHRTGRLQPQAREGHADIGGHPGDGLALGWPGEHRVCHHRLAKAEQGGRLAQQVGVDLRGGLGV